MTESSLKQSLYGDLTAHFDQLHRFAKFFSGFLFRRFYRGADLFGTAFVRSGWEGPQ